MEKVGAGREDVRWGLMIAWLVTNTIILVYFILVLVYIRNFRRKEMLQDVRSFLYLEKYFG